MNMQPEPCKTSSPAATQDVHSLCFEAPEARGLAALQVRLVDRIKRAALRHLHASLRGERWLLHMYHSAEEASQEILREQLASEPPNWLLRQITRHLHEEQAHTMLFAAALGPQGPSSSSRFARAGLSKHKLARWRRLKSRHAHLFSHGSLVPAYATALCAEQMAVRIMRRHCETIGPRHALHQLFFSVLTDEDRHVRLCAHALRRLVAPEEAQYLIPLLAEVRKIETAFGVCGALAMYIVGLVTRALPAMGPR